MYQCTAAMLQSHERWYVVKSRLCRLGGAHNLSAGRETRHGLTVNVVVLQGTILYVAMCDKVTM